MLKQLSSNIIQQPKYDDDDDDGFEFESRKLYNPRQNVPTLSPATPQYDKVLKGNILHFKLPKIKGSSKTPQPTRNQPKQKRRTSLKNKSHDSLSFETPKKEESKAGKEKNSIKTVTTSKRSSSVSSQSSAFQKNFKRYKIIKSDGYNTFEVINDVKYELAKAKASHDQKDVVFLIKGIKQDSLLDITRRAMQRTILENGYEINQDLSSKTSLCCVLNPNFGENMTKTSTNINDEIMKTTVYVSSISEESTLSTLNLRLQTPYNGIVYFQPIDGKFSSSMKEYPLKIVKICRQNGFPAKVVDFKTNIVECDMREKSTRKESSKPTPVRNDENIFQNQKMTSISKQNLNGSYIGSENNSIKVEVPWNSEKEAELIIRSHLTNDYKGKITFIPSIGLYSVVNMPNYPDRIIEICKEYNFHDVKKRGQIIDCVKTERPQSILKKSSYSSNSMSQSSSSQNTSYCTSNPIMKKTSPPGSPSKLVVLPSKDKISAEQIIRNQFESGRVGNVQFSCENGVILSLVIEIGKEYGFKTQAINNSNVQTKMTVRANNDLYIQVPSDNNHNMKKKMQKYIESGFIGKLIVSPSNPKSNLSNFTKSVIDLCSAYGFQAKVESNGVVKCLINPLFFDMSSYPDSQLEQRIKNALITNKVKNSFIVFSAKRPTIEEMKISADKMVHACKSFGCPARTSEFYYQRIFCNTGPKSTKQGQPKKTLSKHTNSVSFSEPKVITIKLPVNDAKAAELLIRKQLSSSFLGVVLFSPKSGTYSPTLMPHFPYRIFDLCSEYGFAATVLNPRLQVIECKMNKNT